MNVATRNEIMQLWKAGASLRAIARNLGLARNTVLRGFHEAQAARAGQSPPPGQRRASLLDPYQDAIGELLGQCPRMSVTRLLEELRTRGFQGGYTIVRERVVKLRAEGPAVEGLEPSWVLRLLLGKEPLSAVRDKVGDVPDLPLLYRAIREGGCKKRNKALVVLGCLRTSSPGDIAQTLQLNEKTVMRYWTTYSNQGVKGLFAPACYPSKFRDETIKSAVLSLLHSPPSVHDINRTSWKLADLQKVLNRQGIEISRGTIRKIIRSTGFKWRKARIVLTSNDPQYREKVDRLKSILANLGPKERFFSIDEFGPFAIKMRGGLVLCDPDRVPVVPQYQVTRGTLIVTAALELSANQVTHFYSPRKDTQEMIKLLGILLVKYPDCEKLYLSWDAASWHDSQRFLDHVAEVNSEAYRAEHHTPAVELVPLPSRAQFLNVIESVFSGMARAIIHNSNYQSPEEGMVAIDRYFSERNEYFRVHPKRAGCKIWGKERVPSQFSEANNCKDSRWR
jgi:transposase